MGGGVSKAQLELAESEKRALTNDLETLRVDKEKAATEHEAKLSEAAEKAASLKVALKKQQEAVAAHAVELRAHARAKKAHQDTHDAHATAKEALAREIAKRDQVIVELEESVKNLAAAHAEARDALNAEARRRRELEEDLDKLKAQVKGATTRFDIQRGFDASLHFLARWNARRLKRGLDAWKTGYFVVARERAAAKAKEAELLTAALKRTAGLEERIAEEARAKEDAQNRALGLQVRHGFGASLACLARRDFRRVRRGFDRWKTDCFVLARERAAAEAKEAASSKLAHDFEEEAAAVAKAKDDQIRAFELELARVRQASKVALAEEQQRAKQEGKLRWVAERYLGRERQALAARQGPIPPRRYNG